MTILRIGNSASYAARYMLHVRSLKHEACSVKREAGFTLIEVLLAVSILAIGIVGVLQAYTTSVGALGVGQENIDIVCLLKEKMAEVEQTVLEEEGISPAISNGEFEDEFAGYGWELDIKPGISDKLNEVTLMVSCEESNRKFTLVTYVENKE